MLDTSPIEQPLTSWEEIYSKYLEFSQSGTQWVFRGQENSEWKLRTTLERSIFRYGLGKSPFPDNLTEDKVYREILSQGLKGQNNIRSAFDVELALLRSFKRRCYLYTAQIPKDKDVMEWLALMRHYFSPSRLLDWSYSFFVALFFAVENAKGDATVWALDTDWLGETIQKHFPDEFDLLNADQHVKLPTFRKLFTNTNAKPLVYAINPYRRNRRLSVQQGIFLCPGRIDMPFMDNLDAIIKKSDQTDVFHKLIIRVDGSVRNDILRHLQNMNVNRAALFPGLEGFARSLETMLASPDILIPEPIKFK